MTSKNFTIDDIHAIRYANYEKTKHLSKEELIEDSKQKAERIKKRLEMLKKDTVCT